MFRWVRSFLPILSCFPSVQADWSFVCIRGGIRGIVELEILAEIESVLGGNIPIQEFFDLIVGTRYVPYSIQSFAPSRG